MSTLGAVFGPPLRGHSRRWGIGGLVAHVKDWLSSTWLKYRAALQACDFDFSSAYYTAKEPQWPQKNTADCGILKAKASFIGGNLRRTTLGAPYWMVSVCRRTFWRVWWRLFGLDARISKCGGLKARCLNLFGRLALEIFLSTRE
jgi:hypothetical protein